MKKNNYLRAAVDYYNLQLNELTENGDTMKRRRLIYKMIENIDNYRQLGGKYIDTLDLYEPLRMLYNEYDDELIYTPTLEDIEEMRYWV